MRTALGEHVSYVGADKTAELSTIWRQVILIFNTGPAISVQSVGDLTWNLFLGIFFLVDDFLFSRMLHFFTIFGPLQVKSLIKQVGLNLL